MESVQWNIPRDVMNMLHILVNSHSDTIQFSVNLGTCAHKDRHRKQINLTMFNIQVTKQVRYVQKFVHSFFSTEKELNHYLSMHP